MVYKAPNVKSTNVKHKRVLWLIFITVTHNFGIQNYYISIKFESFSFKNGHRNAEKAQMIVMRYIY